jgi:hypothetical protein
LNPTFACLIDRVAALRLSDVRMKIALPPLWIPHEFPATRVIGRCVSAALLAALFVASHRATAAEASTATQTSTGLDSPAPTTPDKKIELFNGHSFEGWRFVSKAAGDAGAIWSVKDGVIACLGKPNGYARTIATYHDYALHVEWRWPDKAGNSGIFVNVSGPDKVWPTCQEIQLRANDAGSIRANGGSKLHELVLTAKDPVNVALRQPGVEKPVGEWNSADITCRGDTIIVKVNGVLENEVTGASVSSGAIALQAEGAPVEFRNITIAPLATNGDRTPR